MVRTLAIHLLLAALAVAQSITATAKLGPNACVLGEGVEYAVIVQVDLSNGGDEPELPRPKPPESADYEIAFSREDSLGRQSMTSIVNGRRTDEISVKHQFVFIVKPKRLGTVVVPSFEYEAFGNRVTIRAQTVTVTKDAPGNSYCSLTVVASTDHPYVNQPVQLAFTFRTQKPIAGDAKVQIPWAKAPNGFWAEPEPARQMGLAPGKARINLNGELGELDIDQDETGAQTFTLMRTIYPIAPGAVEIGGCSVSADIATKIGRQLFQTVALEVARAFVKSEPLRIEVRDAPVAGRPASFSGLIGDFQVEARYGKTQIRAGDGVTLTLAIRGMGDLDGVKPPEISGFKNFDVYPPQKTVTGEGAKKSLTVSWLLVPKSNTVAEVPRFEFSWFATASEAFKTVTAGPAPLTVTGDVKDAGIYGGVNTATPSATEIKTLGEDVRPIRQKLDERILGGVSTVLVLFGLLFPPFLVGAVQILVDRKRRAAGDISLTRRRRASKEATARLAEARALVELPGRDFYGKVSKCVTGLVADKLSVPPASVSVATVEEMLRAAHVDDDLVRATRTLLDELDTKLFGGGAADAAEKKAVLAKVEDLIARLDKALKR